MRSKYKLLLILLATISAPKVYAETQTDLYTVPKLMAVQDRKYNINQHMSLMLGYFPDDAFTKGLTLGGAYTYYFTDFSGWEVVNANYVFNLDTGLKKDLIASYNAQPETDRLLDFPQYYITTGFIYTPLYNKNLLFNSSVVHGENSFVLAAGAFKFKQASTGFVPTVGAGMIFRYFIGESTAFKLDIRELVYNHPDNGFDGILDLKAGIEIQMGDSPRETK